MLKIVNLSALSILSAFDKTTLKMTINSPKALKALNMLRIEKLSTFALNRQNGDGAMSAATLIHEAEKDGLRFALTPSRTVKLTGPKDAAEKWAPRLREHKAEIVESLAALGSNAVDAEPIDGYTYDPEEAARFWHNLTARVDECGRLIHQLCNPRNVTSEHRIDLLAVRKTMAPNNLVGDIAYLKTAIAEVERPRCAASFTPRQDRTTL